MTGYDTLLARLGERERRAAGEPDATRTRDRDHAVRVVTDVLGSLIRPGGLRVSPLGAGWSRDLDVHLTSFPPDGRLRAAGWVCMDRLLEALGAPGRGRWAVVDGGRVLAMADLATDVPPDEVEAVLVRCRRRGEVRVREILELRALLEAGRTLPESPVLRAAARGERAIGGDLLARWLAGATASTPPVQLGGARRWVKRRFLRAERRVVVAVSGVDGAGKSSLARRLAEDLRRLGIEVAVVWTRPGLSIGRLDRLAQGAKRLLHEEAAPALERVAGGDETPRSRRGLTGWVWTLFVTMSYLRSARGQMRTAPAGIVVYDRHELDALVTLDVAYRGVALGLHRALVRRFLPRASLTLYLEVDAATAALRKPDDVFDEVAIRRQVAVYEERLRAGARVRTLDASGSPDQVALAAFRELAERAGPGAAASSLSS